MGTPHEKTSRDFSPDMKQFAREFETAIEILEARYLDRSGCHAAEMRPRIKEMQAFRGMWKEDRNKGPTQFQVFTVLQSVAMHLLPASNDIPGEISTAVTFYLALNRMRELTGSTWLAASIYDMEHELLKSMQEIHSLTKPPGHH